MNKRQPATRQRKKRETDLNVLDVGHHQSILNDIKLDIKHKNEIQKKLTNAIKKNDVTICTGPAGTGKTYVSCAQSLLELSTNEKIKKIVLVKSVTTLKSEEIGFLKGTLEEKMEPFLYSFVKNFEKLIGRDLVKKLMDDKIIEIIPIAYMRGINIDNAIIIVDEVQNISVDNIRTILTRLGEDSKMILLGDLNQIDTKYKNNSSLKFLIDKFKNIDGISIVEFDINHVVRHKLIGVIEPIFEKHFTETQKTKSNNKTRFKKLNWFTKIFSRFF